MSVISMGDVVDAFWDAIKAIALLIIGGLLLTASGIIGYWIQDHYKLPTEIHDEHIVNRAVKTGTYLIVSIDLTRHRNDCSLLIERAIYDGGGTRLLVPDEDFSVQPGPLGRGKPIQEKILIPHSAEPGEGFYRAVRTYWCNPFEKAFNWGRPIRTKDHPFTIVPREPNSRVRSPLTTWE